MRNTLGLALPASALVLLTSAVQARADIVFLTSGRTVSVKQHRYNGDSIVLTLRSGGQVTCDRSIVDRIVPDEVPYPEPAAAGEQTPTVAGEVRLAAVPFAEIIEAVSSAQGVNPQLVRALIQVESKYQPRARSRRGAMGLMQLMPATARQYSVRDPFDPRANIEAGVKHLKSLLDRFEVGIALAAYNAGEVAVKRFGGIPPYRETRTYVTRILSLAGLR